MEHWDLVVIGAGPAGLTAGIYGGRSGLKTIVLEKNIPGGAVTLTPLIENYPGFPDGISGGELAERMLQQCKRFKAEVKYLEEVLRLEFNGEKKIVETDKSKYSAEAVIIASGCYSRKLGVPGEEKFLGKGVSYCALCDGAFFKGKRVLVVGGGNTAVMSALFLSNMASKVFLAHRRDHLRAEAVYVDDLEKHRIDILWNTELKEIRGNTTVESVVLYNNNTHKVWEMKIDGVFILIGEVPNSGFAKEAGVMVDKNGYIIVDSRQRTNIAGVYAAGDVTVCQVKQIGIAIGQAIVAATEAFGCIKKPYYYVQS